MMDVHQSGWFKKKKIPDLDCEYLMITEWKDILYALQIQSCQTPVRHSIYHIWGVFSAVGPEYSHKVNFSWRGIPPVRGRVWPLTTKARLWKLLHCVINSIAAVRRNLPAQDDQKYLHCSFLKVASLLRFVITTVTVILYWTAFLCARSPLPLASPGHSKPLDRYESDISEGGRKEAESRSLRPRYCWNLAYMKWSTWTDAETNDVKPGNQGDHSRATDREKSLLE